LAAHVRTNHVHTVIVGEDRPEKMLNAFKAYASRRLNEAGMDTPDRKRWARHGSTRGGCGMGKASPARFDMLWRVKESPWRYLSPRANVRERPTI
jgi:hypothetical protein